MNFFFAIFILVSPIYGGTSQHDNREDHKAGNESNAVTEEGTVRSDNVTKEAVTLLADVPLAITNETIAALVTKLEGTIEWFSEDIMFNRVHYMSLQITQTKGNLSKILRTVPEKRALHMCQLKMSLPHGLRIQKTTERSNAGASSEYNERYSAAGAFGSMTPVSTDTSGFHDTRNYPWISKTIPASVWYRFDEKFSLRKISFTSEYNTPESFKVIANNAGDCRDDWKVIKTVEAAGFTDEDQTRSWEIPCEDQGEYYCYGIWTSKVACGKANEEDCTATFVTIKNITMYY